MDKTRQAKAESLHEWKSQMADFLLERAQKFGDITYPPYQSGRFDWHERGDPSENHQGPALVGGR